MRFFMSRFTLSRLSADQVHAAWHRQFDEDAAEGLCLAIGAPIHTQVVYESAEALSVLTQATQWAASGLCVIGWLAYEAAPAFDPSLTVNATGTGQPLAVFSAFSESQIVQVGQAELEHCVGHGRFEGLSPWVDVHDMPWFEDRFNAVRRAIEEGEFYQLNLTTRLKAEVLEPLKFSAFTLFARLFLAQPARYSAYLQHADGAVLSLSPELFFSWQSGQLVAQPMKGTRQSTAGSGSLRDSDKDLAENVMIVDLLRNDMSRICTPGSVQVRSLFDVLHLPTVEQMTSTIAGKTSPDTQLVDVFKALFPCGSVTGAPKRQSMLRIAQWENEPRGVYCGAMGVIGPSGRAVFNVPIRTVAWSKAHNALTYGVGSGVTWYSDLRAEKAEWWHKTTFLRQSTTDFSLLETLPLNNGRWVDVDLHLSRMRASAESFGWWWPAQTVAQALANVAGAHASGLFRARWLLDAQGRFSIELGEMPAVLEGVQLRLASQSLKHQGRFVLHKTTWRPHYDWPVQAEADFDTLLWDEDGNLAECCKGNVVIELEAGLFTPLMREPEHCNLLPGVFRQQLLGDNRVTEKVLSLNCLASAKAVWFVNSLRQWVSVARVVDINDHVLFAAATSFEESTEKKG